MPNLSPVANIALTTEEEATLIAALGGGAANLEAMLQPFAAAALREYVDMLAGQAMTSASDLRERRLLAILLALPAADFPTDDKIARWFNVTLAGARALLRSTLARHRNRLRGVMAAAARAFIRAAGQPNKAGDSEARFPNAVVISMLNDQLAASTNVRRPIGRKSGTFDTYVISTGSMAELRQLYP